MADPLPDPLVLDRQTLLELPGSTDLFTRTISAYLPSGGTMTFVAEPFDQAIVSITGGNMMLNLDGTSWATQFSGSQRFHSGVIGYTAGTTFSITVRLNFKLTAGQTIYLVCPTGAATTALILISQRAT